MRVNVGLGILGAFIGEFIASEQGLGRAIIRASGLYQIDRVFAAALEYETGRIPDEQRRAEVAAVLASTNEYLEITDQAEALAIILEAHGIGPMDAVHLALASTAKADFFATCDDRLLRKAKTVTGLGCEVISVLGAISEILR